MKKNNLLKILSRRTLLLTILIGLGLFLAIFFYSSFKNSTPDNSNPIVKNATDPTRLKQVSYSMPLRLRIPNIKVDASIDYVGMTPNGAMDVPKGPNTVAWYKLGPRPGEIGSSVIDGHFGWGNGVAAVFDDLHKLKPDDKLYIEDDKGVMITFIVRKLKSYDQNDYAKEIFYSTDNKSHLNLITCKGDWNKTDKSYSERFVVFSDKE